MVQEFKLIVHDDGRTEVLTLSGAKVFQADAYILGCKILEEYEASGSCVYLAYRDGLHKIGISDDFQRREKELKAEIVHVIQCASHKARLFEAGLHAAFREYAVGHEWFRFPSSAEPEMIAKLETQRELRAFLFNHHKAYYEAHPGDWESGTFLNKLDELGVFEINYPGFAT